MNDIPLYPAALSELDTWRVQTGTTLDEARKRFAQFVILECIAAANALRTKLAFKGGNALRFVYGNPRSTLDLDFTATGSFPDDVASVRSQLDAALVHAKHFEIKMKAQRVNRNPKRMDATLPTFQVTVGYQLPKDRYFADFEQPNRLATTVVEVEISLNYPVCETSERALQSGRNPLRVCSLEDIIAEKLRALLQQVVRNRTRPQDVFDIAQILNSDSGVLDYTKIARYCVEKCTAREIEARKAAFDNPEVKTRASTDYEKLSHTAAVTLPFQDAWQQVLDLVKRLEIPD
jgi:predicted nucleotidyltransferase component of viral defense system